MKILLTAVNAKYIHSNPAIYSLKAYADKYASAEQKEKVQVSFREFTINNSIDEILEELYLEQPEVLCFSCYIWNITYVKLLIKEIKVLLPYIDIWLGGPEASHDAKKLMEEFYELEGIMYGEGEAVFLNLCRYYAKVGDVRCHMRINKVLTEDNGKMNFCGIVYRNGKIFCNPPETPVNMSDIPFPYADHIIQNGAKLLVPNTLIKALEHRIIYYESSRGCPFSCSYCLSSVEKHLRFRDLALVKKELQFFMDQRVKQVKFTDRTFNCKKSHAVSIWSYLLEHDNGVTNFHFEISADLLSEEEISVLSRMRPGLVQLEIGVQSTNEKTIQEINRKMNLQALKKAVKKLRSFQNINLHLDLIAGLPYENLASFQKSFDEVYHMCPDQLQLGFLKVLKGSAIEAGKEEYNIVHRQYPPYETMYTKWISYEDMLLLKEIEEMVESYYNSGQFIYSLKYLEHLFDSPFVLYRELGKYYKEHFKKSQKHARIERYEILLDFYRSKDGKETVFTELLIFDLYFRENMKSRPEFAFETGQYKKIFTDISALCGRKTMAHLEVFSEQAWRKLTEYGLRTKQILAEEIISDKDLQEKKILYFDYTERNPLNNNAAVYEVITG